MARKKDWFETSFCRDRAVLELFHDDGLEEKHINKLCRLWRKWPIPMKGGWYATRGILCGRDRNWKNFRKTQWRKRAVL